MPPTEHAAWTEVRAELAQHDVPLDQLYGYGWTGTGQLSAFYHRPNDATTDITVLDDHLNFAQVRALAAQLTIPALWWSGAVQPDPRADRAAVPHA